MEHNKSQRFKNLVACGVTISLGFVYGAVYFHYQLRAMAIEIDDEPPNHVLPPEVQSHYLISAKP
jgi:hypothetical protein